ncbi:MAG: hypothetical protein ACI9WT_001758 [Flavobacterium sp.]|jgi:hypothetical protein
MVYGRYEVALKKKELVKMELTVISIKLGEIELSHQLAEDEIESLENTLRNLFFRLLTDEISKTIEQIKNGIIDLVHDRDEKMKINLFI